MYTVAAKTVAGREVAGAAPKGRMSILLHIFLIAAYGIGALAIAEALDQGHGAALGISPAVGGIAVFLFAALLHEVLARRASRRAAREELRQLTRRFAETQSDLETLRRDLSSLSRDAGSRERELVQKRQTELQMLRGLIEGLATKVGMPQPAHAGAADSTQSARPSTRPNPQPEGRRNSEQLSETVLDILREALEDSRMDLYLQPIVSLPQRKVRHYECYSRIRDREGRVLAPSEYLPIAEQAGLIASIDNLLLFRAVQLIRRLRRNHRNVGFFLNLARRSLEDDRFIDQFAEFLKLNPELIGHLVFEIAQPDFELLGPHAEEAIFKLGALGCRFSLDNVTSLDIDWKLMVERQFRFIKLDAEALLGETYQETSPIDLGDLKQLLGRHGIDLIAEKIEDEQTVVNLLDFDVDFGQGYLFGEPRRSREDA